MNPLVDIKTNNSLATNLCPKIVSGQLTSFFARRLLPLMLLFTLRAGVQAPYTYVINYITGNNAEVLIVGYNCSSGRGAVTIPSTINGLPVTSIELAFSGCTNLTGVTIPDGVHDIKSRAFEECINLASVTIPNSVTNIEGSAFQDCWSLANITIPNSVASIGGLAFANCTSLAKVTMPDGITSLSAAMFMGCTSPTSVAIPNRVTNIGELAFGGCTSLTNVTIPNSVTSIENEAFGGCTSLTSVTIPASVTQIGGTAFESSGLQSPARAKYEPYIFTTLAGRTNGGAGSVDGTGSAARFNYPQGVAVDSAGNVYVADSANDAIRKVAPVGTNWIVTTLAGESYILVSTDGTGSAARFADPSAVAADSAGNVYVTDANSIRKITPGGVATRLA